MLQLFNTAVISRTNAKITNNEFSEMKPDSLTTQGHAGSTEFNRAIVKDKDIRHQCLNKLKRVHLFIQLGRNVYSS